MSTPDNRKSLAVSPETHALVMAHATRIRGTVDEAIAHLADPYTVRVLLSEGERARWETHAESKGMRLGDFVRQSVETGLSLNTDMTNMIAKTYFNVVGLCHTAGLRPSEMPVELTPTYPVNSGPPQ